MGTFILSFAIVAYYWLVHHLMGAAKTWFDDLHSFLVKPATYNLGASLARFGTPEFTKPGEIWSKYKDNIEVGCGLDFRHLLVELLTLAYP